MTTPGFSEDVLRGLTDRELLEKLAETDTRLELLQDEIRSRMQRRAAQELKFEQHAEIARMVEHLEQAKIDWHKVREFFRESIAEVHEPWATEDPT